MEIKKIAKNTGTLIVSRIFSFVIGIVRAKINAIYLGTEGVGITSQLLDAQHKMTSTTTLGMESGCIKLLSENKYNEDKTKPLSVLRTYLILVLPFASVVYMAGLFFSEELSIFFLGDAGYKNYFLVSFIFFPLIIIRSVPNALLYAYKKINLIVLSEILSGILIFVSFILLVINFELLGAVINISIAVFITFLILIILAYKKVLKENKIKLKNIFYVKFSKKFAKELLTIGGIGMTLGYYQTFCDASSRAFIVNKIGVDSFGLYGPIIAWANLFTGFIYPSIYGYLGPRFSETKSNKEVVLITNDAIRLLTFVIIPIIFIGIASREIILPLFYSKEFLGAAEYLPLHFIGILFNTWVYIFSIIFVPTGRVKKIIPFTFGQNTLGLFIILLFTGSLGLWALVMKYFIIPVIFSIFYYIYFIKEIEFKLQKENIFIILYSIAGSFLIYIISGDLSIVISLLLTSSLYFFLKTSEREFLKKKLLAYNIFRK